MASIYIDEDVGRDDSTANGTESAPYKTLLHAFMQHAPTDGNQYLTRKSQTEPTEAGADPASKLEWKPATKSAVKKATNLYEQRKRKAAKERLRGPMLMLMATNSKWLASIRINAIWVGSIETWA